jgi:hypothetical protein
VSEHWYDRNGLPRYEVVTNGGMVRRPTTLADGRKNGWLPSVTTVLSVLAKPQLENWKVNQGILAALTLPRSEGESESAYISRILADSKAQAIAAAEEGTRIHDACECAVKGLPYEPKYVPHVQGAVDELNRLFPDVSDWVAEASFGSPLGYGGKVDLHSPSTGIVVDYKGKDGDFSDGKKLAYDQHYQLAAYQNGLRLPRNVCANLFVSRTHPGKVASHVWKEAEMEQGWQVFLAALALWKAVKKFDPSFTDEAKAA